MRISVKRLWATFEPIGSFIAILALAFALPVAASADDDVQPVAEPNGPELFAEAVDELDRWVPSLSIDMGLMIQESAAAFSTGEIQDPDWVQIVPALAEIRPPASGSDRPFAPIASVSLELMTPGLRHVPFFPEIKVPGSPRLFVHGGVIASFPHTYRTAKNGDVDIFSLGFPPVGQGLNTENVIDGQGGTVQSRLQRWQYEAGAGFAVTTDLFDRRLRIKPSFEYLTQEIEVKGTIHRAKAIAPLPKIRDDLRFIVLNASETKRFYGMGAGIEFEFDTRRAGPVLFSLFGKARGYRMMGDLKIRMSDANEFDEDVDFRFRLKRYTYRAGIGIRARFAPE